MSSSIKLPGENFLNKFLGKASAAPSRAVPDPAVATSTSSPSPQASSPLPAKDQLNLSKGQAAAKLNSLAGVSPTSAVGMVKNAQSMDKLVEQVLLREFPGLKLSPEKRAKLTESIKNSIEQMGFDLREIQKNLPSRG